MASRRSSASGSRSSGRRESAGPASRTMSTVTGSTRRASAAPSSQLGFMSLAALVNLKSRAQLKVKEAKSKALWRKVRCWVRIIGVLYKMHNYYADAAMNDPSSPFYCHPGIDALFDVNIDKDHYMFFDPAQFKANRQRRMSQEVQRILSKLPDERTAEEIHFAMIGLRDIQQLAIFPVRMQRNIAQFGYFECYDAKRMILKQGHRPEGYYFMLYGNVVVAVKSEETGLSRIVVELGRGEAFGELAIVSGGPRNSSVLTKTYTELLVITKSVYETVFLTGGIKTLSDPDQNQFLSSLKFLRGWPVHKMSEKVSQPFVRFMYIQRNAVITRDSQSNKWLIVVKSGSVTVLKKLVRSKPTVSKRSGLHRDPTGVTAFQCFVTNEREYSRFREFRNITLPPPLQLSDEEEEEEEDKENQDPDTDAQDIEAVRKTNDEAHTDHEEDEEPHKDHEDESKDDEERQTDHEEDDDHDDTADPKSGNEHSDNETTDTHNDRIFLHRKLRPQTCVEGKKPTSRNQPIARKAWSAKHPGPVQKSAILSKRTRLKKQRSIHFEQPDDNADSKSDKSDIPTEIILAQAKRTLLDDLDSSYLARRHVKTEADRNPQFVYVQTLTKGDVFGLAPIVFSDQPSLCLVSNGAECMMIDKKFYTENCPPELSRRLKVEVSPYPSDQKMQQDLVNRVNWDVYKKVVKRQVFEQCPHRVTITPL